MVHPAEDVRKVLTSAVRLAGLEARDYSRLDQMPVQGEPDSVAIVDVGTWISEPYRVSERFRNAALLVISPDLQRSRGLGEVRGEVPEVFTGLLTPDALVPRLKALVDPRHGLVVQLRGGEARIRDQFIVRDGRHIKLAPKESQLLHYLACRPGVVIPKETVVDAVWGPSSGIRTLYSTLNRLRTKLERNPDRPAHLITRRGGGYAFHPKDPVATTTPHRVTRVSAATGVVWPFIGRTDAVGKVIDGVRSRRMVTVRGPAGIGKTRVIDEVCDAARSEPWCRRLRRVDLRGAASAAEVVRDIARVLHCDVSECETTDEAVLALAGPLSERDASLLVLDHVDGALAPVGSIAKRLVRAAPGLTLLLGSREPLRVVRERVVTIGPLDEAHLTAWREAAGLAHVGWMDRTGGNPRVFALLLEAGALTRAISESPDVSEAADRVLASMPEAERDVTIQASVFARRPSPAVLPPRSCPMSYKHLLVQTSRRSYCPFGPIVGGRVGISTCSSLLAGSSCCVRTSPNFRCATPARRSRPWRVAGSAMMRCGNCRQRLIGASAPTLSCWWTSPKPWTMSTIVGCHVGCAWNVGNAHCPSQNGPGAPERLGPVKALTPCNEHCGRLMPPVAPATED